MCGIAPWHVHVLCDNSWEGGRQYKPSDVGDMSLDMIYMLMADKANLRRTEEKIRTIQSLEAAELQDKDGFIKGRAEDGSVIKSKIKGKSLATKLREEAEAKRLAEKKAEEESKNKKSRRRGRNNP